MEHRTDQFGQTGKHVQNGTPEGYTAITPFIVTSDPRKAIAFYEAVFQVKLKNATEMDVNGESMIVHAEVDFGNGNIQLGAANPAYGLVLPPDEGQACYSLCIYVPNVDRTLELAVEHGATVREPVVDFVSGDRYGSILDPCGIRWSIMTRMEDISEEESQRRVEEWSKSQ
ncbi:VOC family protein [Aureibacillus halotolerans]|uniref:Putative glyoxalase superfamily protein PhnB n=1 Tax=Aureibacillus halotolerans TaxID=1508390 RepID=A0A4R6TSI5_9BACI|nr:VOC family protein [Aureibacillus halotolerans]TDQ36580.1 putative glyoxalase superfamily protein PhnB [Aureibacillus halotolerans]